MLKRSIKLVSWFAQNSVSGLDTVGRMTFHKVFLPKNPAEISCASNWQKQTLYEQVQTCSCCTNFNYTMPSVGKGREKDQCRKSTNSLDNRSHKEKRKRSLFYLFNPSHHINPISHSECIDLFSESFSQRLINCCPFVKDNRWAVTLSRNQDNTGISLDKYVMNYQSCVSNPKYNRNSWAQKIMTLINAQLM